MSAELILEVTQTLALTQAANPNEKDGVGFSNADFPAAFTLVALGDVNACAALLRLYPKQSAANGITPEILQPFLGESVGMANAEARAALAIARREAAGTLAWTTLPTGKVLFNGLDLPSQLKKQLKLYGKRTNEGWIVDSDRLAMATEGCTSEELVRWDEFKALVSATTQQVAPRTGKPAPPPMEIAYDAKTGLLDWTNPFSDTGVEIRKTVKRLGAAFKGDVKKWALRDEVALQALLKLADDLDVPVHGIEPSEALSAAADILAEEVRSGVVKVLVVDVVGEMVFYRTRSKVEGAWEAAKATGGWFDSAKSCIRVAKEDLRNLLTALDKVPGLDASPLLPILAAYEAAQEHLDAPDVLALVPTKTSTGYDLFPHQIDGVAYLLTLGWDGKAKGGILADDMGLGKTIQACIAANLRFPGVDDRFLIICPASLKSNWAREIHQWLGVEGQTVQVLTGRSDTLRDARWTIVNYDILANYVDVLRAVGFKVMICDEAHNLRNPDTQRGVAVIGAKGVKDKEVDPGIAETCEQVWMLTGTPIMNRPRELWNLLRGVGHGLGCDWWRFATRYCGGRRGERGWDFNGSSNMGELSHKIGSIYMKRLKSLVLNLPPKIRAPFVVDLSDSELAAYHAAVDAMLGRLDGEDEENEACILAELNALKLQTARAKMPATLDLTEQLVGDGKKVVIFSFYMEVLDALQEKFGAACVRIDGSVSPAKRQAIVDRFQADPSVTVFIGQIEAAGVGITLTASQDVIINDLPWTPAILAQAEDRTYRIGQTGTVNVRHMEAAGTFDGYLRTILNAKQEVIDAFETGADAASKARFSVIKKLMAAIKKDAKERTAAA